MRTFENFTRNSCNEVALAACYAVVARPFEFNPLFITGKGDSGKTHLAEAICHEYGKRNLGESLIGTATDVMHLAILKVRSEHKTEELITEQKFSLVVIDDVQDLEGAKTTLGFLKPFIELSLPTTQFVFTSREPELSAELERILNPFKRGYKVKLRNIGEVALPQVPLSKVL